MRRRRSNRPRPSERASLARNSALGSGLICSSLGGRRKYGVDRLTQALPVLHLLAQRSPALRRGGVDPPAPAVDLLPMASDKAFFLQSVEDRIQGSLGNLKRATGPSPQLGGDGVAVQGALLKNRQQQTLELSLDALHTSTFYASFAEASTCSVDLFSRPREYALTAICSHGNLSRMSAAALRALGEPHRVEILDLLREGEQPVGCLVKHLGLSQPAVSKHLRVLKDAGLVESRVDAQRRLYRVRAAPLAELDDWLEPYRRLWEQRLDKLEDHLDRRRKTS